MSDENTTPSVAGTSNHQSQPTQQPTATSSSASSSSGSSSSSSSSSNDTSTNAQIAALASTIVREREHKAIQDEIATLTSKINDEINGTDTNAPATTFINGRTSGFLWGAATITGLFLAAPLFRPLLRGAVKGGIRLGRYAKETASSAKEQFEDITAEAKADLSRDEDSSVN